VAAPSSPELVALYLDLVKRMLRRSGSESVSVDIRATNWKRHVLAPLQGALRARGYRLVSSNPRASYEGETMISGERLDNLQECVEQVISDAVPGDLIETGVWRGGATILMRAVLAAHGITDRTVWVADSFEGFPSDEQRQRAVDRGVDFTAGWGDSVLAVDVDTVKRNFERYGLLDNQVQFLVGWFADTLPTAPIEQLAVLRLDGDLYESTTNALDALYPKLSVGGYVIVDDYGWWESCRRAVDDYRDREGISEPILEIDGEGVYWRRRA
jgi:O-methyltransferase